MIRNTEKNRFIRRTSVVHDPVSSLDLGQCTLLFLIERIFRISSVRNVIWLTFSPRLWLLWIIYMCCVMSLFSRGIVGNSPQPA